jgi:hypothetical protein
VDSRLGLVSEEDTEVPDHGGFFLVNLFRSESRRKQAQLKCERVPSLSGRSIEVLRAGG